MQRSSGVLGPAPIGDPISSGFVGAQSNGLDGRCQRPGLHGIASQHGCRLVVPPDRNDFAHDSLSLLACKFLVNLTEDFRKRATPEDVLEGALLIWALPREKHCRA